jgi:hypothetical protein
VQISFIDPATERLFCTQAQLESRFEAPLSAKIMVRMAVLKAAPSLASVPSRPPINLRKQGTEFLISVTASRSLRFRPIPATETDLKKVDRVTVLGLSAQTK